MLLYIRVLLRSTLILYGGLAPNPLSLTLRGPCGASLLVGGTFPPHPPANTGGSPQTPSYWGRIPKPLYIGATAISSLLEAFGPYQRLLLLLLV